jgi:hypothetical protein
LKKRENQKVSESEELGLKQQKTETNRLKKSPLSQLDNIESDHLENQSEIESRNEKAYAFSGPTILDTKMQESEIIEIEGTSFQIQSLDLSLESTDDLIEEAS